MAGYIISKCVWHRKLISNESRQGNLPKKSPKGPARSGEGWDEEEVRGDPKHFQACLWDSRQDLCSDHTVHQEDTG